jgi:hypothetical protein
MFKEPNHWKDEKLKVLRGADKFVSCNKFQFFMGGQNIPLEAFKYHFMTQVLFSDGDLGFSFGMLGHF